MLDVLLATLPVVALIAIGYALRRADFPGEGFWRPAARLVYFVFLPALLVRLVASADIDPSLWRAQLSACLAVVVIAGGLLLSRKRFGLPGPAFTSVFQGGIRHNTYIGLAIGGVIFDSDQVAVFALIVALVVPLVNALAVLALGRYGRRADERRMSVRQTLTFVTTNPLILACILGAAINLTGAGLPFGVGELLRMLGQPALPIGLLVVGAGLNARSVARASWPLILPATVRLLVYPALALGAAYLLDVPNAHRGPLLLLASLPTAASAYVLALELGGDEGLMARIITFETLLATCTIPCWLYVVG